MEMNETINPSDLRGGGGWPREGKGGPQILYIERVSKEREGEFFHIIIVYCQMHIRL